jgi:nuclear migration protein JNM1
VSPTESDADEGATVDGDDKSGVDKRRLRAKQARSRFTPARVDADEVDFSDRLNLQPRSYRTLNRRRNQALHEDPEELANFSEEEDKESVDEKLNRLRREVELLKAAASEAEPVENRQTDAHTLDQIEKLSETLDLVYIQRSGSTGAEERLARTLQSFQSHSQTKTIQPQVATPSSTSSPLVAESLSKAADMDARLAFIERTLGLSQSQLPEAADEDYKAILPQLSTLERVMQIATAQPTALEAAQAKSRNLIKDVERVQRLKQEQAEPRSATSVSTPINGEAATPNVESSDQTAKINALYGILPTVESLAPALPLVLERLRTLRILHSSAADAQSLLADIERRQKEQDEEIETWRAALDNVEAHTKDGEQALSENVEKMGEMIRGLEVRLAKK